MASCRASGSPRVQVGGSARRERWCWGGGDRLVGGLDALATTPGTIHVRDSKYRETSPRFALTPEAWAEFVTHASRS
ncbi:DUF397 domain-containing protein [Streptomyces sp. cg40]|uniref:DUF397 domain-containing protein n=1 Tax=Streptomyces sp. cg40 TaxID=3419764 RepID=UPI003CFF5C73